MYYKFTFGSFFVGLIVLIIGAVMTVYHQKLADNLASGISSYERFKFWGLVVCGVGFGIMLCLHTIPLGWQNRYSVADSSAAIAISRSAYAQPH